MAQYFYLRVHCFLPSFLHFCVVFAVSSSRPGPSAFHWFVFLLFWFKGVVVAVLIFWWMTEGRGGPNESTDGKGTNIKGLVGSGQQELTKK